MIICPKFIANKFAGGVASSIGTCFVLTVYKGVKDIYAKAKVEKKKEERKRNFKMFNLKEQPV